MPSLSFVQASSKGRIRVGPYSMPMPNGWSRIYQGLPTFGNWDGDRFIIVIKRRTYKMARLICEAFHGEPPADRPYCLHKDSRNNVPTNLEWNTQKANLNAPGFIAYCHSRTGANSPTAKARAKAQHEQS